MDAGNISKNSDYFLWARFRSGDKEALSDIFYSNYELLYNYGLKLYNEPNFIKDCIQELFYELISKLSSLGPTDNIRLYLLASLRRKVFDKLNKNDTYKYSEDEMPGDYFLENSPEENWIDRELETSEQQDLNKMLHALSKREKEAIYLKFYKNFSYQEITQVMNVNYQSARKLIYRAVSNLREWVAKEKKK